MDPYECIFSKRCFLDEFYFVFNKDVFDLSISVFPFGKK